MHFGANMPGSECHQFDDAFRPSTPQSSREVESAEVCWTEVRNGERPVLLDYSSWFSFFSSS